jgi:enoyl-CoA hydratase/carnithine racemase
MAEMVLYEVEDRVATVTLNRPERLNAISWQLMNELIAALEEAERDLDVHVAVVQGAGRAFSTGYEIGEPRDESRPWSPTADRDSIEDRLRIWFRIPELRLPIIAKVHGYCIAGATQLASICDVTFAAEDTRVGSGPQLPLGAGFVTAFWAWHIGPKRAKRFAFPSGEFITGTEAAELGLFNEAVPAEMLDAYVADYVKRISKVPKDVLAIHKLAANRVQEIQGFRAALRTGAELDSIVHFSPEVDAMRNSVKELGVRGAIDAWKEQM